MRTCPESYLSAYYVSLKCDVLRCQRSLLAHPPLMGSCCSRTSFTVNKTRATESVRTYPVLFSMCDAESVLRESNIGTYLLYKDFQSDKIYLSVRLGNRVRHHRISEVNRLFYLEKQPYPYLDSIIFYHRRHKLRGIKLKQQAQLSARVVKAFAQKIVAANGNLPPPPPSSSSSSATVTPPHPSSQKISRSGSLTSLITSSSDSTANMRL